MIPFANPTNFTRPPIAPYSLALPLPSSSSLLFNRRRVLFNPFHTLLSANAIFLSIPFLTFTPHNA
jgi:hypothetical protein